MPTPDILIPIIGGRGDPRAPVIKVFHDMGILVASESLPDIRRSKAGYEGNDLAFRVECCQLLESGDPSKKNEFYFQVADEGLKLRKQQLIRPYRFTGDRFSADLAEKLGITTGKLSLCFRAMRADASWADLTESQSMDEPRRFFYGVVVNHIAVYTQEGYPSDASVCMKSIEKAWDHKTISDFYDVLYSNSSGAGIAAWQTSEVEFDHHYYEQPKNKIGTLSAFDRLVLEAVTRRQVRQYATIVKQETNIRVNDEVLCFHARALLGRYSAQ